MIIEAGMGAPPQGFRIEPLPPGIYWLASCEKDEKLELGLYRQNADGLVLERVLSVKTLAGTQTIRTDLPLTVAPPDAGP